MTAATLTYNVPILPSPYDATATNSSQPGSSELATGELNGTSVLNAVTYNWLHNAATSNLYLMQQLGLFLPYNPGSTGGSLIACPQGGIVSVQDSVTGFTQFYVALTNRPIGFADPSTDATNFGLVNFQNLVNSALPGTSIIWTGSSAPSGYLQWPTSQTNISRTTYSRLYAAIGTTWGAGNGSTTFGMPWAAAGSAVLHGITGIGGATNGAVILHDHSGSSGTGYASIATGTASLGNESASHTHGMAGAAYGLINGNTFSSATGGYTAPNSSSGTISLDTESANHSHTDSGHSHVDNGHSHSIPSAGGSTNQAAGTTIMICVKY